MTIVLAATRHPTGVLRTIWRTKADPTTGEDEAGARSSNVLVTVGCGSPSSMTAFSVKCSVPGRLRCPDPQDGLTELLGAGLTLLAIHDRVIGEQRDIARCVACAGACIDPCHQLEDLK